MRKYHICDLLTLSRLVAGGVMIYFVTIQAPLWLAFLVFILGEVTDALDGYFHNKYPYPEHDGKFRFWREPPFPKIFDTGSDLLLGTAYVLFLYLYVNAEWVSRIFIACMVVGCLVSFAVNFTPVRENEESVLWLLGIRRFLYVAAIFALVLISILGLGRSIVETITFLAVMCIAAYLVYLAKGHRLTEK